MKALVLAGGTATRLRPLSLAVPKQLIPIAGTPVLEHVLRGIAALGVTDVGIVVGPTAPKIMAAVGDARRLGLNVRYITQSRPLGLAHCVRLARSFLADDDFVLQLGDNLLPGGLSGPAGVFRRRRPAAQLMVRRVADPREFGVAEMRPDGLVRRLTEKPAHPRSDLAVVGVYFFTSAVHEAVRAIGPGRRGELELTDAVQWMIDRGVPVRATEYAGGWWDIGRPSDVLSCSRHHLDLLTPAIAGRVDVTGELSGLIRVEPGAVVRRSRLTGPVLIGAGSVIEDARLGPYVAVGRDCVVRGTRVSDSIVFDDATLSGGDLRSALVTREAAYSTFADSAVGRSA